LVTTRDSLLDMSAEDRPPSQQAPAPRDQAPAAGQTVCLRKTPRQATSAVAHVAPPPEDDDPLLAFPPYCHTAPRRNSITPDLQRRFIATLAATGIVKQAAKSIGRSLEALYKLRHRPGAEGFAAAWDAALERGVQRLEDCALERALKGTRTPIVSHGQILGWWDKPDNNLLRFLLQHRLSARYGPEAEKPTAAIYRRASEAAMADAQAFIAEQQDFEGDALFALLEHMVENRLAGRSYVSGLDFRGSLREVAEDLRARKAVALAGAADTAADAEE
jgi:hypothetical protein